MAEYDVFEARLRAALVRHVADGPTDFDALGFARTVAAKEPRRRGVRGLAAALTWRSVAVPRLAWVLLAVGLLLALVVGSAIVGARRPDHAVVIAPSPTPLAVCPPGSNPDKPGPVDQARPPDERSAVAFDRRAGRLVAVASVQSGPVETWTFDVCTNTWAQMHPSQEPPGSGQLVYDVDSDVTIGIFQGSVWAYDFQADSWTRKGLVPGTDAPHFMAYDPVSGLVVAAGYHERMPLWNYDVEADTWTPIHQATTGPMAIYDGAYDAAYDASVDRLVACGDLPYDGNAAAYETWLIDIRTGTWVESRAERPADYGSPWSPRVVYDEAAERTVVLGSDQLTAYDASTDRWEILAEAGTVGPTQMAYDSLNRRLVGWGKRIDWGSSSGWGSEIVGAVEALDLVTREWTVLLEPGG